MMHFWMDWVEGIPCPECSAGAIYIVSRADVQRISCPERYHSTSLRTGFEAVPFKGLTIRVVLVLLVAMSSVAHGFNHDAQAKFLLVSDIHFNPMADPSLVNELVATDPARWESILDRTTPGTFSQYKSDTNWWLLESALKQFPATLPHPTFIVVTGDLLAHDFRETFQSVTHDSDQQRYRAFVLKTVQFLALELQHKFPGTKIFITPGNNDDDCGDYSIQANGTFLKYTAPVARALAGGDEEFTSTWKTLGSFNLPHPTLPGVRLISMNSIFLSQQYQALSSSDGCTTVSSTAAADLLAWLDRNLSAAAQADQKVWLMFHIPPGIDGYASAIMHQTQIRNGAADNAETCGKSIVPMWVPDWTTQFVGLLAKYQSTMVAGFAGHTHSDDFRLIGNAGAESKFVLINPAISPVYSQNPSFRVVNYRSDGTLTDHTTYYLANLATASRKSAARWKKEYRFTRKWKGRELNSQGLGSVYSKVVVSEKYRNRWLRMYAVSGPAETGEKPIVRELYCAVEAMTVEGYKACYCAASAKP